MSVPSLSVSSSSVAAPPDPDSKALVYESSGWRLADVPLLKTLKNLKTEPCIIFTKIDKFTKDTQLQQDLLEWFPHTPDMFWSETGVKHNGFFGCHAPAMTSSKTSDSTTASGQKSTSSSSTTLTSDHETTWTYFRLIVKILNIKPDGTLPAGRKEYDWHEMAFLSLSNTTKAVTICFDMPDDIPEQIRNSISSDLEELKRPFGLHIPILEQLLKLYDTSVWGMANTVRGVEKKRQAESERKHSVVLNLQSLPSPATSPPAPVNSATAPPALSDSESIFSDPARTTAHFERLFEISRHITHSVETVQVAAEILDRMQLECQSISGSKQCGRLQKLKWLHSMLRGIHARSVSNEKRLASEQTLLSNMISQRDSEETKKLSISSGKIAVATAVDSEAMKSIALVTMTFLPATFVTAFLGMNFFSVEPTKPGGHLKSSKDLWIFFVIAVPLTIVVLLLFQWWQNKRAKDPSYNGDLEKGGKQH